MNRLKVSVVTPSLNQGQFIKDNLESVLSQRYSDIEHIVVDGDSNDGTVGILQEFARAHGNSIRWISEPDRGQSDAVNKGLRMATGEVIGWLNADDTYQPGAVRTAVEFLSAHPNVGMVYGRCAFVNEDGKRIGEFPDNLDFDYRLLTEKALNFIPQPAVFFRKEVLDMVGLLDVNLHMAMDYDLWIRIGQKSRAERIPAVLANFRLSSHTKSVAQWSAFWPEVLTVLVKHCGTPPLPWYFKRYYRAAKKHGYDSLRAFAMLEEVISGQPGLEPCKNQIQVKGLSQALMESAREGYLLNRRRHGLRDLAGSLRMDRSLIARGEFLALGIKLILGRWTIRQLKSIFRLEPAAV